jgi:hypothetical protein
MFTDEQHEEAAETFDRAFYVYAADQYLETADWADAPRDEDGDEEETIGFSGEAIKRAGEIVTGFINANAATIKASGLSGSQVGQDLWLTQNHHGTGFWDRGLGELGDELTKAAHAEGSADLYVDDEGWTQLEG